MTRILSFLGMALIVAIVCVFTYQLVIHLAREWGSGIREEGGNVQHRR
jgi:hypothetical protein